MTERQRRLWARKQNDGLSYFGLKCSPNDRLGARWPPWKYDDMGRILNKRHIKMCHHMGVMKITYLGR